MAPPATSGVTAVEVSPEATVSIQVYASDVSQAQGVSIRLVYDAGQVVYDGTDAGDLFPNAQVLAETGTDPPSVSLGIASMGGRASAASGLAATVRFRTRATFTGTTVRIVEAVLGRGGERDTLKLNVAIDLNPASAGPSPDFDADGRVGFSDFLQFASQYGTAAGDGRYDTRFDLDGDGSVGFSDFLVLAGQFGQDVAPPTPTAPDRDVLVALYNATGGDNWTTQTNWLTDNPLDTWHGVTVENGRVTGISLPDNNLNGVIPTALGNLTVLDSLRLDNNALSGSIPNEVGRLVNLRTLSLQQNPLSGAMPVELGNLSNLRSMQIWGTNIDGPIPVELTNLTGLEVLSLPFNQLGGEIPPELGNLENLTWLVLAFNQLSGPIPPELGKLKKLKSIQLHGNELGGPIPIVLGDLNNLLSFDLNRNKFSGTIPSELGNLNNLKRLSLGRNQLTGTIPLELGKLEKLTSLYLSENLLSGAVPSELGNLSGLVGLYLSDNADLSGALPQSLTRLTELKWFYFEDTGLCAPTDASFQRWLESIEDTRGANCE